MQPESRAPAVRPDSGGRNTGKTGETYNQDGKEMGPGNDR